MIHLPTLWEPRIKIQWREKLDMVPTLTRLTVNQTIIKQMEKTVTDKSP